MAQNMVAQLVLKLDDQLGGPLRRLTEQLDKMRQVAAGVNLNGLKNATEQVDVLESRIAKTTGILARMGAVAREVGNAFGAMGAMAASGLNDIRGKAHAFGEAGSNLVNKGFGAAAEGFAVYEPIKQYAERDTLLRSIGIMEHLQGPALESEIRRLNALVNNDALKNGLSSESVAEAYKDLLGQGLPRAAIDGIIGAHSAAAKAYGIPPDILGPVTGALVGNMKIAPNEADAGAALAAIAAASQTGRFKMEDFSRELPGLTGVAASLGMTGRGSLNQLAAALEISTKTASDPTQAGVNLHDLLAYITSNREDNLSRKKLGIDMPALLLKGEKDGRNPLDVYLDEITKLTAGKSPVAQAQAISSIVTNQQARNALLALVQHRDEFESLRKSLSGINAEKLKMDEGSAGAGAQTGLDKMAENIHQISMTLGQGFAPVLIPVNAALGWINEKLAWMNANFPQTTAVILGGAAALLLLGAGITLLGAIVPVFTTGWALLGSAITFVVNPLKYLLFLIEFFTGITAVGVASIAVLAAAFVAIAVDIYENWGRFKGFFSDMWEGVKAIFHGNIAGIAMIWRGEWGLIKQIFIDFGSWIDGWSGGLATRILDGITAGWGKLTSGVHGLTDRLMTGFDNGWVGRHLGLATPAAAAAGIAGAAGANGTVNVRIQADPGTKVNGLTASGNVNAQAPNRGATVSRP